MQHTSIPFTLAFGPQGCMAEVKGRVVAVWRHAEWPRLFCGRADGGLTFLSLSLIMPDRTADTLSRWLRAHPGVHYVGRDRSPEYARGASEGAPSAQQVVDRWHLMKNLREALERVLGRLHETLKQRQEASGLPVRPRARRRRSKHEQMASQMARFRREPRYEEFIALYQQVVPFLPTAHTLPITRPTVPHFSPTP